MIVSQLSVVNSSHCCSLCLLHCVLHVLLCKQAELNEVLEDGEEDSPAPTPPAVTPSAPKVNITCHPASPPAPAGASGLEPRLLERIEMYQKAMANAKAAGETSKVRRYDRGLKVK